jgi:hypothetical protein
MKKLITTFLFSAFSLLAFTQSTFTEKMFNAWSSHDQETTEKDGTKSNTLEIRMLSIWT